LDLDHFKSSDFQSNSEDEHDPNGHRPLGFYNRARRRESAGCRSEPILADLPDRRWSWAAHSEAAALMSVHGTAPMTFGFAGADDGKGGVVLHWDGTRGGVSTPACGPISGG